ncbi:MAG: SNF2-related protein [Mycoplasmatales bacterium]
MEIFNLELIKKSYFKEEIFLEGEAIYNIGTVTFDGIKKDMITDICQLKAVVAENKNVYKVELGFKDKEGSAILMGDRSCTCCFYNKSHENCAHMAALICNMNNYTYEELFNDDCEVSYTSEVIKEIEATYVKSQYHKYEKKKNRLIPYIIIQNENIYATFKVGYEDSKQYILKDLEEFIHFVDEGVEIEYGKNFICSHQLSEFNLKSQQLILFMKSKHSQISASDDKKSIIFSTFDMLLFFKLYAGDEINIKYNELENKMYRCTMGKIPFEIKLKDNVDMVVLVLSQTCDYVTFINNTVCSINGNIFSYYNINDIKLVDFLQKTYKKILKIKKEDLFSFYDNVLLSVKKDIAIDTNIDVELLYKDVPKLVGYIDLDVKNNVEIELKVLSSEGEINFFELEEKNISIKTSTEIQINNLFKFYGKILDNKFIITDNAMIYEFNKYGIKDMNELVDDIKISQEYKNIHTKEKSTINLGVAVKNNLLEIDFNIDGINREELFNVLKAYHEKKKFFRLNDGKFVDLETKVLGELDNFFDGLNATKEQINSGLINVDKFHALFIDHISRSNEVFNLKNDQKFIDILTNIKDIAFQNFSIPDELNAELREYQKYGYQYLTGMKENGFGIILADDMGLGKTIQIITFLLNDIKKNEGQTLITCPSSLILNWEKEINSFAPSLKVLTINMDGQKRKEQFSEIKNHDVIVTSYDLLKRDIEEYQEHEFENFIIDESQYIKNSSTKNFKTVIRINSKTNIALTGTPIENKLSELWSIMNFVVPGYLNTYKKFNERFETPIMRDGDLEKIEILKKLCSPFILRRLKKDVLLELPDKSEVFQFVKMTEEQEKLYRANIIDMKQEIDEMDIKTSKLRVLSMLMRLRQIACDPALVYKDYKGGSAKLDATIDLIIMSIEAGHKVLLFSQFTSMLEIIKYELIKNGISHYMLTGSTKKHERHELSESFNKDDTSVFLISLKAGGTGLNLVGADIVIHFDPWWNMSAQNQATDRVYRIGQENNVTVYKVIADHTIEGKIVKMQEKKGKLAESILEGNDVSFAAITEEELLQLFD